MICGLGSEKWHSVNEHKLVSLRFLISLLGLCSFS